MKEFQYIKIYSPIKEQILYPIEKYSKCSILYSVLLVECPFPSGGPWRVSCQGNLATKNVTTRIVSVLFSLCSSRCHLWLAQRWCLYLQRTRDLECAIELEFRPRLLPRRRPQTRPGLRVSMSEGFKRRVDSKHSWTKLDWELSRATNAEKGRCAKKQRYKARTTEEEEEVASGCVLFSLLATQWPERTPKRTLFKNSTKCRFKLIHSKITVDIWREMLVDFERCNKIRHPFLSEIQLDKRYIYIDEKMYGKSYRIEFLMEWQRMNKARGNFWYKTNSCVPCYTDGYIEIKEENSAIERREDRRWI